MQGLFVWLRIVAVASLRRGYAVRRRGEGVVK